MQTRYYITREDNFGNITYYINGKFSSDQMQLFDDELLALKIGGIENQKSMEYLHLVRSIQIFGS